MSGTSNPFRASTVLLMLLVGAGAFLMTLYALGQGWDGSSERNGGEHAASTGLTGFAALAGVLEGTGRDVQLSRSLAAQSDYNLMVLTPPIFGDAEEVAAIIEQRRENDVGPTLLILPKWMATPIPDQFQDQVESEDGWVFIQNATPAAWFDSLPAADGAEVQIKQIAGWSGFGMRGSLPNPEQVQALTGQPDMQIRPLVRNADGAVLVGELAAPGNGWANDDYEPWRTVVVFEPDLMNNFGMDSLDRAELAAEIVDYAAEDDRNMPIAFDLVLPGLGASENLLTLAFAPPFLAATLCLLFAALVIAWRGFNRFGPPVAEAAKMKHGKRQLARNGASLVARAKRFHLLAAPYAALMGKRIADALGIREAHTDERDAAIDRALDKRGHEGATYRQCMATLREADKPKDIIRAASALKDIERMLKR
ncbi:MAG: DUF4350 domain-containing protein [Alteraurantiacibacter sp.]